MDNILRGRAVEVQGRALRRVWRLRAVRMMLRLALQLVETLAASLVNLLYRHWLTVAGKMRMLYPH